MSYLVQARLDDHALSASMATAKDAFEKAIEWQARERFSSVTISHGHNTYSIDEFASVMARLEIAKTLGNDDNGGLIVPDDQGWRRKFEAPIDLPDGRKLNTLRDAADYITALPEEESALAQWQVAIEALMLAARSGPTMLARIAFMKALRRDSLAARASGLNIRR